MGGERGKRERGKREGEKVDEMERAMEERRIV